MKGVRGRPKIAEPKSKLLQVRMDERMMQLLDECVERKQATRAEIVREGIVLVKESLERTEVLKEKYD
ncbi:MAG: hypothetical protein IJ438_14935 [Clostridia bacterium]|nr:hypothetical protein [Clostridia bacterium]MBQ8554434.1 hypothetical protein [Clostridia bacterium]MBQ8557146.1 hypothetical protein [Clostridia bacterium]